MQSDSTTHTADEVADSSLLLQHNGQSRENFHHGTSGYPEGFSQGITSATMPLDMAPPPAPSSAPAKKKRQARSVENLKDNDDDLGAFDLFRAASDGEINQSSSPSPRYQKEENYFQFKQNAQQKAPSTSHAHEEPKQLPSPPVSNGVRSENNRRGGTSITMMHCDYHSIYPEEKSTNAIQSVEISSSMENSISNTTNKRVTSITMMHCNYHSIYPEESTTAAGHGQSPLAGKPDSSPTRGRNVSSTADPAASYSYDRDTGDQQHTSRRRSDTTGGTPYDLQPKRNYHDDLSDISPRRHSTTASDRGYYRNKSNSSVGSAASGTPSSSSSPTGSKFVAGRARKSSDATNLLFSASLGFSNLLKAGSSRDKLQCNGENVAEM